MYAAVRPETSTNVRSIKEYAKSDAEYGAHQDIAIIINFLVKLRLLRQIPPPNCNR